MGESLCARPASRDVLTNVERDLEGETAVGAPGGAARLGLLERFKRAVAELH